MQTTKKPMTLKQPFTTVYIGNLDYDRGEKDIKKLFSRYGEVIYVSVVKNPETQKNKGIAFVRMREEAEANEAVKGLNGLRFDDRTLKVSIANNRFEEHDRKVFLSQNPEVKAKIEKAEKKKAMPKAPKTVKPKGLDALFTYLKTKK